MNTPLRLAADPNTQRPVRTTPPPLGTHTLNRDSLADHLPQLKRAARRLCASEQRADSDAEDLVQDTLERILRRERAVTGADGAYLMRALKNTHLDRIRAHRARLTAVPTPEDFEAVDPVAHDRLANRTEARAVLHAVADLPANFRDAVVALDVAGYSPREASALTGIAAGTLMSRAHRGRARIQLAVAA